jgi:hypothetical protein
MALTLSADGDEKLFIVAYCSRSISPPGDALVSSLRGRLTRPPSLSYDDKPVEGEKDCLYKPMYESQKIATLLIPFEELRNMRRLSSGSFSNTFLSYYKDVQVVVKIIRRSSDNEPKGQYI